MLNRVWAKAKTTSTNKPKVEEHIFRDGSKHYSFRDRLGRPSDIEDYSEAMEIVKNWGMIEVTEEMRSEGWIE